MGKFNVFGSDHAVYAKHADIGIGVHIESDIGSPDKPCDYVELGDHVYIGEGCRIGTPHLTIRDYTKIHRNTLIFGRNALSIGYNCWVGEGSIIDAEGNTRIGDNVGIGAHSQLWSHIRHGDVMMGCKYLKFATLNVMSDAWILPKCLISPVLVAPCSMVLAGSTLMQDTEANHIYGGSPAKDLTDKLGAPFAVTTVEQRVQYMHDKVAEFATFEPLPDEYGGISVVTEWSKKVPEYSSEFNAATRQYRKHNTPLEIAFMKFLLPEAKFTPVIG